MNLRRPVRIGPNPRILKSDTGGSAAGGKLFIAILWIMSLAFGVGAAVAVVNGMEIAALPCGLFSIGLAIGIMKVQKLVLGARRIGEVTFHISDYPARAGGVLEGYFDLSAAALALDRADVTLTCFQGQWRERPAGKWPREAFREEPNWQTKESFPITAAGDRARVQIRMVVAQGQPTKPMPPRPRSGAALPSVSGFRWRLQFHGAGKAIDTLLHYDLPVLPKL